LLLLTQIEKRILLCAHWDSRPFADQDTAKKNLPIDGANDGASGVAVLMEIARQLNIKKPEAGVDIIFFDVEDYGQPDGDGDHVEDSYALGTQYWAKNPHKPNYTAENGILQIWLQVMHCLPWKVFDAIRPRI
jgi:hypothetical protein